MPEGHQAHLRQGGSGRGRDALVAGGTVMRTSEDLGDGWFVSERAFLAHGQDLDPRQRGEELPRLVTRIDLERLAPWEA